jgi:hypothetical protein
VKPESLLDSAWHLATLPFAVAVEAGRDAADAGERAGRALAHSGERSLLRLLDAAMDAAVSERVLDRLLARIEEAGVVQRTAQHLLENGVVDQLADRLLNGPELPRMLRAAFRSELPDEVVAQLLASEAVWVLVDEIASSPAVTEAITQQSVGFAQQVGAKTRDRSRDADARLQQFIQRLGPRRHGSAETREGPVAPVEQPSGGEGAP